MWRTHGIRYIAAAAILTGILSSWDYTSTGGVVDTKGNLVSSRQARSIPTVWVVWRWASCQGGMNYRCVEFSRLQEFSFYLLERGCAPFELKQEMSCRDAVTGDRWRVEEAFLQSERLWDDILLLISLSALLSCDGGRHTSSYRVCDVLYCTFLGVIGLLLHQSRFPTVPL